MKLLLQTAALGAALALGTLSTQASQLQVGGGYDSGGFSGGIGGSFGSGKQTSLTSTGVQTGGEFVTTTNKKGDTTVYGGASAQGYATQTNEAKGTNASGAFSTATSSGGGSFGYKISH